MKKCIICSSKYPENGNTCDECKRALSQVQSQGTEETALCPTCINIHPETCSDTFHFYQPIPSPDKSLYEIAQKHANICKQNFSPHIDTADVKESILNAFKEYASHADHAKLKEENERLRKVFEELLKDHTMHLFNRERSKAVEYWRNKAAGITQDKTKT